MGFEKGHKLATGRPKGAINRSTEMMKLTIARAVDNTLNTLSADLEKIRKEDPERAIELALKLMEFTLPKLSRTELRGEIDQRIHTISVNITKSGSSN